MDTRLPVLLLDQVKRMKMFGGRGKKDTIPALPWYLNWSLPHFNLKTENIVAAPVCVYDFSICKVCHARDLCHPYSSLVTSASILAQRWQVWGLRLK